MSHLVFLPHPLSAFSCCNIRHPTLSKTEKYFKFKFQRRFSPKDDRGLRKFAQNQDCRRRPQPRQQRQIGQAHPQLPEATTAAGDVTTSPSDATTLSVDVTSSSVSTTISRHVTATTSDVTAVSGDVTAGNLLRVQADDQRGGGAREGLSSGTDRGHPRRFSHPRHRSTAPDAVSGGGVVKL
jgi:hypothetical protein